MSVQGVKSIAAAIKAAEAKTTKGLRVGLLRAGLFLQRESQKIVPIDTNALRASAATRIEGSGLESSVIVSYGTEYAVYVHEDLNARHKPGKTAKFLTRPLHEKKKQIQAIVLKAAQGK